MNRRLVYFLTDNDGETQTDGSDEGKRIEKLKPNGHSFVVHLSERKIIELAPIIAPI